jgi:hypothetical protein
MLGEPACWNDTQRRRKVRKTQGKYKKPAAAVYGYSDSNMFHLPFNNLLSLEPCLIFCIVPTLQNIFMHPSAVSTVTSGRRHTVYKTERGFNETTYSFNIIYYDINNFFKCEILF